jgi:hypothetical protein
MSAYIYQLGIEVHTLTPSCNISGFIIVYGEWMVVSLTYPFFFLSILDFALPKVLFVLISKIFIPLSFFSDCVVFWCR